MASVITVTSGQEGVGKTSIALNLALQLVGEKQRTCLFDAEAGIGQIRSLLGIHQDGTPKAVTGRRRSLADILLQTRHGVDLLPGSAAIQQLTGTDAATWAEGEAFSASVDYGFLLIDGSVGASKNTLTFCLASTEVIVVVTPDPESLTSACSVIHKLHINGYPGTVRAVVNRCKTVDEGRETYETLQKLIKSDQNFTVPLLGLIFEDPQMQLATRGHQAISLLEPESVAARGIREIVDQLIEERSARGSKETMQSFWSRLLWLLERPMVQLPTALEADAHEVSEIFPVVRDEAKGDSGAPPLPIINQMVTTLGSWLNRARGWQANASQVRRKKMATPQVSGTKSLGAQFMAKLLRNYPFEKRQVGYREAKMDIYHVEREAEGTLACAIHDPDEMQDVGSESMRSQIENQEKIKP